MLYKKASTKYSNSMLHPIAAGTKFKRGIRIIASSVALIGGLCWFACCSTASRRLPLRHILVLHSYAPDNPRCLKMNGLLEKELEKRGIRADILYRYMDTERRTYAQRYAWYNALLDSLADNRPDAVLINDDYAFTFYLQCGHPLVGQLPAVFTGVYQLQPLQDTLKKYPNITGRWDHVDYLANVRFMEKIFRKHVPITVYYETTPMAKRAHQEIKEQLKDFDDIRFNHYYLHQLYPDDPQFPADEELFSTLQVWGRQDAAYPFSVLSFRPYRDIKGVAIIGQSGDIYTQEYFLNDLYGIITVPLGLSHISPTFTVINEPFGFWNAYLGGYFTTWEQQTSEGAELLTKLLNGVAPEDIPVTESAKEYVVDWKTLERFGLDTSLFPAGVRFVNMPFYQRYKLWIISISLIFAFTLISVISYLLYLYMREQKRTREALDSVLRKNVSLELAIQGGNTYVWKFRANEFIFEHVLGNLPVRIPLNEFRELIYPDDLAEFDRAKMFLPRADKLVQHYRCKFTGKYQWWEFRFSTIEVGKSEQWEVSGLLINIQSVKDKEAELIEAKKLAEKAELKQSFIDNMSHEIRTPLNAIVGFSNLLATSEELDEEDKQEFIRIINLNNDLLLVLINDILELSRLDSGQVSFDMQDCSVKDLIEDIYSSYGIIIPARLNFLKQVPDNDACVYADCSKLTQVLTNFLNNAVKFTQAGYIKLGYELLAQSGEVSLFVEDTGKGIPAEQQKMVFERFYKQDEFAQGTGLGLSICRTIVDRLGGRIQLDSEPGRGSRFSIILPAKQVK